MSLNLLKILAIFLLFDSLKSNPVSDPIYEGCGTTKTCLGFPDDCLPDKDCVTFSSTYKKGKNYHKFIIKTYLIFSKFLTYLLI